jgi:hypothetical protein
MLRAIVISFGIVFVVFYSFGADTPVNKFQHLIDARHAEIEAVTR